MAFSYNTSSPAARDKVRALIGDTTSTSYVFEDAELDIFLDLVDDEPQVAAAMALRTLAADRAKMALRYRLNGSSMEVDKTTIARQLLEAAAAMEKRATSVPFEYESVLEHEVTSSGEDLSNYVDTEGS